MWIHIDNRSFRKVLVRGMALIVQEIAKANTLVYLSLN